MEKIRGRHNLGMRLGSILAKNVKKSTFLAIFAIPAVKSTDFSNFKQGKIVMGTSFFRKNLL